MRLLVQQGDVLVAARTPLALRDAFQPRGHAYEGESPSGKVPASRVRLRISRLRCSTALLVCMRCQWSRGPDISQHLRVAVFTTLAAFLSLDFSSSLATSSVLVSEASRDSMTWSALGEAATRASWTWVPWPTRSCRSGPYASDTPRREKSGDWADHAGGLVAGEHPHAARSARPESREELAPTLGRFG